MSEKSMFEDLMLSMEQASAYATGDHKKARVHKISVREVPTFDSQDVKRIRHQLHLTQKLFATLMGVSVKTVESWEKGTNHPNGAASRLLEVIESDPEIINEQKIVSV